MAERRRYDSPWKTVVEALFPEFMELFFPDAHRDIDWSIPVRFLDKEFSRVTRGARAGSRAVDKLAEVARLDGRPAWVLVHIEVQAQREETFARRMYRYHLRIFDHFDRKPVSLAVLADQDRSWRPQEFGYSCWGCRALLEFPVAKLTDWADRTDELCQGGNPFGIAVAAHLASLPTRRQPQTRFDQRKALYRAMRRMGVSIDKASALVAFMDWILELPDELEDRFWDEVREEEGSTVMQYMTRFEEKAMDRGKEVGREEGRQEGREEGKSVGILIGEANGMRQSLLWLLDRKFGAVPDDIRTRVEGIDDTARLADLMGRTLDADSLEGMGL